MEADEGFNTLPILATTLAKAEGATTAKARIGSVKTANP
jgi:hypothetical protein